MHKLFPRSSKRDRLCDVVPGGGTSLLAAEAQPLVWRIRDQGERRKNQHRIMQNTANEVQLFLMTKVFKSQCLLVSMI